MSYHVDCAYCDCLEFPSLLSGLTQAHVVSVRVLQGHDLFVLCQHVIQDVEEDVNMVLLENQGWTETN